MDVDAMQIPFPIPAAGGGTGLFLLDQVRIVAEEAEFVALFGVFGVEIRLQGGREEAGRVPAVGVFVAGAAVTVLDGTVPESFAADAFTDLGVALVTEPGPFLAEKARTGGAVDAMTCSAPPVSDRRVLERGFGCSFDRVRMALGAEIEGRRPEERRGRGAVRPVAAGAFSLDGRVRLPEFQHFGDLAVTVEAELPLLQEEQARVVGSMGLVAHGTVAFLHRRVAGFTGHFPLIVAGETHFGQIPGREEIPAFAAVGRVAGPALPFLKREMQQGSGRLLPGFMATGAQFILRCHQEEWFARAVGVVARHAASGGGRPMQVRVFDGLLMAIGGAGALARLDAIPDVILHRRFRVARSATGDILRQAEIMGLEGPGPVGRGLSFAEQKEVDGHRITAGDSDDDRVIPGR